jgi:predicted nucleic-acid-binding protein
MDKTQQQLEIERKLAWSKYFREHEELEGLKNNIAELIAKVNNNGKTFICEHCLKETDFFLCEHGKKYHRECYERRLRYINLKIEEIRGLNVENKEELKNLLLNTERTIGINKRIKQLERYIKGYKKEEHKTCLC